MKSEQEKLHRINQFIKASPVIVIDENGKNLGAMPTARARDVAIAAGLDLVEISPGSRPPVCRVMDFGKFRFEQSVKEKKVKRNSGKKQTKEIHLTPNIQSHDIETKLKSAFRFLDSGHKVNVKLEFRRREMAHQDLGFRVMNEFLSSLKDHSSSFSPPSMDGRNIFSTVSPKETK